MAALAPHSLATSCLQPTYEGLKLEEAIAEMRIPVSFAAYLRGIETPLRVRNLRSTLQFAAYLRGIETGSYTGKVLDFRRVCSLPTRD